MDKELPGRRGKSAFYPETYDYIFPLLPGLGQSEAGE